MRVLIFGASGMIGQGVLLECIRSKDVTEIVAVGRAPVESSSPKVHSIVHKDMLEFESLRAQLGGFDACYWCLGVSSNGVSEDDYTRITYDYTMAAARVLVDVNPKMTFVFISGEGADRTSKRMWARVKARAEDDLAKLPFHAVYVMRPGFIEALDGIRSRTKLYDTMYIVLKPLLPLVKLIFKSHASSTRNIGRAMIALTERGYEKTLLFSPDFNRLAGDV